MGVGVGASGHRHHGGELRVAERGETAGDGRKGKAHDERRPGPGVPRPTGGGRTRQHEDARADDGADAEERKLYGAEAAPERRPFGLLRMNGLATK